MGVGRIPFGLSSCGMLWWNPFWSVMIESFAVGVWWSNPCLGWCWPNPCLRWVVVESLFEVGGGWIPVCGGWWLNPVWSGWWSNPVWSGWSICRIWYSSGNTYFRFGYCITCVFSTHYQVYKWQYPAYRFVRKSYTNHLKSDIKYSCTYSIGLHNVYLNMNGNKSMFIKIQNIPVTYSIDFYLP